MTHYQALELPPTATTADIRRAYRRLAFLTHPDRTPDPDAHSRYLAITTAYGILSNAARRRTYDMELQGADAAPAAALHRARELRRRADSNARRTRASSQHLARYAARYARALRLARPLLAGALLLCASLALDYALATTKTETVRSVDTSLRLFRRGTYLRSVHETERGAFALPQGLPVGTRIAVQRTPFWRTAVTARLGPDHPVLVFPSIYRGARNVFWLGLLLSAILALVPSLHTLHRILASVGALVFLGLTLAQMFV